MSGIVVQLVLVAAAFVSFCPTSELLGKDKNKEKRTEALKQEEYEDYYQKWLKEDIVYIITEEEEQVFGKLTTADEKEEFIEQFWHRRDPDLRTAANEYKEEHYRRIAYANERFPSGLPGWRTDRGRTYIIHGPPTQVTSHGGGGFYARPMHEGGGVTSTYPFEVWRYRYIEGIGEEVELEFVDASLTGEYRMALNPEEKDALLHLPGAGLTLAEEMGLLEKKDRPFFSPGRQRNYPYMATRQKDDPFDRFELYTKIKAPKAIRYNDLKELVNISVGYETLPFEVRKDYFKLNDGAVLVPVTIEFDNKELSFASEKGQQVAKLVVYGIVTSITKRVVDEFDDDVYQSFSPEIFQDQLLKRSTYQKILTLDRKMRYRIDLVVKDVRSGRVGVVRTAIAAPAYGGDQLKVSSLILSEALWILDEAPDKDMFVLGDVHVRPSLLKSFSPTKPLGVYLQVYNAVFDQASLKPSLRARYKVSRDEEIVIDLTDEEGESIQFFSGHRVVLIANLPINDLEPGKYSLEVEVHDQIKDQKITARDKFQVARPLRVAASK